MHGKLQMLVLLDHNADIQARVENFPPLLAAGFRATNTVAGYRVAANSGQYYAVPCPSFARVLAEYHIINRPPLARLYGKFAAVIVHHAVQRGFGEVAGKTPQWPRRWLLFPCQLSHFIGQPPPYFR